MGWLDGRGENGDQLVTVVHIDGINSGTLFLCRLCHQGQEVSERKGYRDEVEENFSPSVELVVVTVSLSGTSHQESSFVVPECSRSKDV